MSLVLIPCEAAGQALWSQRTTLASRDYVLTFRWSQRAGRWSLDVADQDGDPIASGRALVPGISVLRGVRDARRPAGEIVLVDTQSASAGLDDPTFASLGLRHRLVYVDGDDLAAAVG